MTTRKPPSWMREPVVVGERRRVGVNVYELVALVETNKRIHWCVVSYVYRNRIGMPQVWTRQDWCGFPLLEAKQ